MGFEDYIKAVKLPIKYKLLISISSAFIIFVPKELLQKWVGIQIDGTIRIIIGLVFLFSASITIAETIIELTKFIIFIIYGSNNSLINKKQFMRIVEKLSNEELSYISSFIKNNAQFIDMPLNDGVVIELQKKRIIQRQGEIGTGYMNFSYKISSDVFNFIKENQQYLR